MTAEHFRDQLNSLIVFTRYEDTATGKTVEYPLTMIEGLVPPPSEEFQRIIISSQDPDFVLVYNLISQEYYYLNIKQVKECYWQFFTTDMLVRAGQDKLAFEEWAKYVDTNLVIVNELVKKLEDTVKIETQYINNLDDDSEVNDYLNLFFGVSGVLDRDEALKMLPTIVRQDLFVYEPKTTPQQRLLNQVLGGIDIKDVAAVKAKWLDLISHYASRAIKQLNKEKDEAIRDNNSEDVEEIDIIINIVNSVASRAKADLDGVSISEEITHYWPAILLPAPRFVQ